MRIPGRMAALLALALTPSLASAPAAAAADDKDEREEAFEDFQEALDSGNKAAAADALVELIGDEEREEYRVEAWGRLGALLEDLELPYAALAAYREALVLDREAEKSDEKDAYSADEVAGPALDLAAQLGDEMMLEEVFSGDLGLAARSSERSRVAWLGAKAAWRSGELATALAALTMVEDKSPVYPRAQLLKGVVLSQQGRFSDALAPMLTAASLAEAAGDAELVVLANLNTARVYYAMGDDAAGDGDGPRAAGNFARASEYYARVPRSSHDWPQAQFERAWAHYRLQDMGGALGYTQTHISPFFDDWYFPEAEMLRIYALFLLCKFPSASDSVDAFKEQYAPIRDEASPALLSMSEQDVFDDVVAYVAGADHRLPTMFLRDYRWDERFLDTVQAIQSADAELKRLDNVASHDFAGLLEEALVERRAALVEAEGALIKGTIQGQVDAIDVWLQDTDILKLDMLKFETRLYEQAAVTGEIEDARATVRRKLRRKDSQMAWVYEGEFWADELGWYRIDATPECPASLTSGGN